MPPLYAADVDVQQHYKEHFETQAKDSKSNSVQAHPFNEPQGLLSRVQGYPAIFFLQKRAAIRK